MLLLKFNSIGRSQRITMLKPHLGTKVAAWLTWGERHDGTLDAANDISVVIGGRVLNLLELHRVLIRTGGDWASVSPGKNGPVRDAKLNLRLHSEEKEFLMRAAALAGKTVTELVLDAALVEASQALGENVPEPK